MAHILLIDDDEAVRSMLRRTLERTGHTVTEAAEGRAGLRALDAAAIDLVITDILMPDMDGIETITALHRSRPQLKVIAMSGGGRLKPEGYLQVATVLGANRVLRKPFDPGELIAAIEESLK
ncbi:MAG TPA: response regulator [Candidatus Binatia bacterium]|nr:response regulator [Candidatus Binatia bacterium]